MKHLSYNILLIAFLAFQSPDRVKEIIRNTDQRKQPTFLAAQMRLIYKDNTNRIVNERKLKYWRNWNHFNSEMVLLKFMEPEEVRNTAFLTITDEDKTRQIIFMPGLGRLRTLKQTQMNSSFMNSDFYYSDLKSWELAKNDNQLINETEDHYYVESVFKRIFYNQRLILKIDKKNLLY